ncbi:cyclin-dependent kinase 2-interacting protein isoform X1 [Leptinotarsa decemlineata]|uniref:cyclin-dependent kinase 2-interacting protein isoform X1 n=1 Tax=Leptinotarsa decemlineata TaxID=7539 RepID=UPI003D306BD6
MKEKEAKTKFQPLQVTRSPVACSPQKNLTGSIRIARDIAADIYNTIQRWNTLHISGAQFVKMIAVEKAVDPKKYSPALEELTTNLYEVVQNLKSIEGQFRIFKTQIRALEKVDKNSETLFLSLNMDGIANLIENIVDAYLEEFKVKELVLENIAHSRTKDEVMFFAACWTLQAHISSGINLKLETLLLDTGHRKVS